MSNTQALLSFRLKEYVRSARLNYQALKALDDIPNYHKAEGEQTCSNCYFFQAGNCTKFKAKVKPSYTCDEWKGEIEKKEVSPPPSTVMAHGVGGLFSDPALETSKKKKKQVVSAKEASLTPPQAAQSAAKKALEWRDKYGKQVKAMTPVGWTRARQLASGKPVSMDTVKRMAQFNRHRKNAVVNEKYKNEPWRDNGHVAWLGWGGTSGIDWAISQVNKANDKRESTTTIKELATTYKHPGHGNQKVHGYRFGKTPSFSKAREYRKEGLLQDYLKRARTSQGITPVKERNAARSKREQEDFKSGETKLAITRNGQTEYDMVKAKIIGNYAVHNNGYRNEITETSTGLNLTGGFKTQKGAMKVARYVYERYGNPPFSKGEQAVSEWGRKVTRDVNGRFFDGNRYPFDYYSGRGVDNQGRDTTTKETTYKPGGKSPGASIKNPRVYEALRKKGMSKRMAAAISNAQVATTNKHMRGEHNQATHAGAVAGELSIDKPYYIRDTLVTVDKFNSLPESNKKRLLEIKDEYDKSGYTDARTQIGPNQSARITDRQREQLGNTTSRVFKLEDETKQLLKSEPQLSGEARQARLREIGGRKSQLNRQINDLKLMFAKKLNSPRDNPTKLAFRLAQEELDKLLVEENSLTSQKEVKQPTTPQATKDPLHIAVGKSLGQFGVKATLDAYGAGPEEHGSAWKAPVTSLQAIQAALVRAGYKQSGGKFKKNSVLIDTGKDDKSLYLYITDDNGTTKKGMKEFVRTLRTNSNVYSI